MAPEEPIREEVDPTQFINAVHGGQEMSSEELEYVKALQDEVSKFAQELWNRLKSEQDAGPSNGT